MSYVFGIREEIREMHDGVLFSHPRVRVRSQLPQLQRRKKTIESIEIGVTSFGAVSLVYGLLIREGLDQRYRLVAS